jgi:hypothetical protein
MSQWQPIETAPRDGTEVIGCYVREWAPGRVTTYGPWTVAFDGKKWRSSWHGNEVLNYMSDFGSDYKEPECDPTHWMHLPHPPVSA